MGFEDSSSSGWPGTDWIEDILLHQSGPKYYDQWVAGTLPWTSEQVVRAWQAFGEIANTPGQVHGGTRAELLTNYGRPDSRCSPTRRDATWITRARSSPASIPRTRSVPRFHDASPAWN